MIFKKIVIDGKEYYQRVDSNSEDGAKSEPSCENTGSEIKEELVEGEITGGEELSGEEKFSRDAHEFFERVGEGAKNLGERIVTATKDLGGRIATGAKDLGKRIKEGTESLFGRDKSPDPDSTEARLLRLLPYMNKEETHEVFEKILANDETVKHLDIATIMPFISAADCDTLFKKCIELGNESYDIAKAIPFVSEECLSDVVTGYIEGKYEKLNIDALYPFLPDKEIKRIFYHILACDKSEK